MSTSTTDLQFAEYLWGSRPMRLEYRWVGDLRPGCPVVVFLHEGLGALAMWKDFPEKFCTAHGCRGLVFSRYGYGQSTPKPAGEFWPVDFMHRQATEHLPAFFAAIGLYDLTAAPWLYGHSDGGSIALLHAAAFPERCAGLVVAAPHILVEDVTIASIEQARVAYATTDLRQRLGRYHADPDSAFRGWNEIWLDPAFRAWDITDRLPLIRCPVLAIQGEDDEYGTLEQIRGIQRVLPATRLLILPRCGHSPHRDQAQAVLEHAGRFITGPQP